MTRKRVRWSTLDRAKLARSTAVELARELGITVQAVRYALQRLGIEPTRAPLRTGRLPVDWDRVDLGSKLDRELAAEHGVSTGAVKQARAARGVTPPSARSTASDRVRALHRAKPVLTPTEIAREVGCSRQLVVWALRMQRKHRA